MTFRDRLIKEHPFCIFCGGQTASETVDHVPARAIFANKQRPLGLEFAACRPCNDSTRKSEQVVAWISRAYPDPTTREERLESQKLMRSAEKNNPGLLREMYIDAAPVLAGLGESAFRLPSWNFLDLSGPICKSAIMSFGKKLGLALHYEMTGRIVPKGGGVFVDPWFNMSAMIDGLPQSLLDQLGPGHSLIAGKNNASKQFRFAGTRTSDGTQTCHVTVFREAFALLLFVAEGAEQLSPANPLDIQFV